MALPRKTVARWLMALLMVLGGLNHFLLPDAYVAMMPAAMPYPLELVWISGVFEILGGLGLAYPGTRRFAAYGIVALLIAVFPANLNQALNGIAVPGLIEETWQMWVRLPFQIVLIGWAWWVRDDGLDAPVEGETAG